MRTGTITPGGNQRVHRRVFRPRTAIAEALEVWREGERVFDALPTTSSDRPAVELAVAEMRVTVAALAEHPAPSEATMADARHKVDLARYTVAVVAGRLPVGTDHEGKDKRAESA